MLSDNQIDDLCCEWLYVAPGRTYEEHRPFARAIESAATAPLLARIAELERLRSEDLSHALDLAAEIARLTQQLEGVRLKSTVDASEFNRAIDFAIDQGSEARHFLTAWREGDTADWPEFAAAIKEQTCDNAS